MSLSAQFSGIPARGPVPHSVFFNDLTIEDGNTVNTWEWNFGDGQVSSIQNPSNTYNRVGVYDVSLTVKELGLGFQGIIPADPTLDRWENIAHGAGLFVAVSRGSGVTNPIMTSSDGITWTRRTVPATPGVDWRAITWNDDANEFLVFSDNSIQTLISSDGINWSIRNIDTSRFAYGLAYGVGLYIQVSGTIWRSINGVNWTYTQPYWNRERVDFINGVFVATGGDGGGAASNFVGVSADGISWVPRYLPITAMGRTAYGNGVYVLTRGRNPGGDDVLTSPDLTNWTVRPTGLGGYWWDEIVFDSGLFVMISHNTTGNKVATSPDGINWTPVSIVGDTGTKTWYGLASNGSGNIVISNRQGDAAYSLEVELASSTIQKNAYITVEEAFYESEGDMKFTLLADQRLADIEVGKGDIVRDPGFETAILISLFTDRRSAVDDELPDKSGFQGGWWGDTISPIENDLIGSRLWLLRRAKFSESLLNDAKQYCEEALQWMVDDRVTDQVIVETTREGIDELRIEIKIPRPSGNSVSFRYFYNWEYQIYRRTS